MTTAHIPLSEDSIDDLLYAARAADLDFLKETLAELCSTHQVSESAIIAAAVDPQTGNGLAHYAAANGCTDILAHILALPSSSSSSSSNAAPTTLITRPNTALNTPLHYASLNGHLPAAKLLLEHLSPLVPAQEVMAYLTAKNAAGHDAAFEAEAAEREGVVAWLLGRMDGVDGGVSSSNGGAAGEEGEERMDEGGEGQEGQENQGEEEDVELMRVQVGEMDVDEK